jgi:transcriptional regulator with XRE-family HTH domain
MSFARRLKQLREAAGLTQAALALKSGLSLGVVRDYEQGRKGPALRSAFKLAEALGVPVEAFKDGAEADPSSDPEGPPPKEEPGGGRARKPKGGGAGKGRKRGG